MNGLIDFKSRFRILKGGKISLVVSALSGSAGIASAAPSGGTVTSGTASISQSGSVTNIEQSTQKASINWNNFSIDKNENVNFNQLNSSSITLNKVVDNEKSIISGALNANGQVWILNSNGVLFSASINTSAIIATTVEFSDTDFQAGNYDFKNAGSIKAVKGKVHLVGANEYTLNLNGNSIVNLIVNKSVLDSMVKNSGTIIADGGEVYLTTNAVNELIKSVINNTGIIEANSLDGLTEKVDLFAHGGTAKIAGSIEAIEGFVETSGDKVKIDDDFKVSADKWLIDPTDFTIAESAGDISGATLSSNLESASAEIQSVNGETEGNGDIFVNDTVSWDANTTLNLNAQNDIYINADITATNTDGKLALYYGQANVNTDNESIYNVNATVNLKTGQNFETKLGNDVDVTIWTVITELGTADSTTGTDLQGINGNLSVNYVLGANIDASDTSSWNSGKGFDPLGDSNTRFSGNFDGLGHTISNLYINRISEYYVGLFGYIDSATIQNIGVIDSKIKGYYYVGGLVGYNSYETISNSYATGKVSGSTNIGGFVGSNSGTITNSFWDKETISQTSSSGSDNNYGKTTTEMQTLSIFTDAGWNISGKDGAYPPFSTTGESIWKMIFSIVYLNYNLSDVISGYRYDRNDVTLSSLWNASTIFGSDYIFIYNMSAVTGFANAGTYSGVTVDVLKSGYTEVTSRNTAGSLVIDKKAIDLSVTKTYDGNTSFSSGFIFNIEDIVGDDSINIISGNSTVSSKNLNTYDSFSSNTLVLDNSNYTLTGGVIDATTTASTILSSSGIIGQDLVSFSGISTFTDKNAGEDITVTVSTLSKIGTDALNYNITKSTATDTATISVKDITVTVSTLSKIGTDSLNYNITKSTATDTATISAKDITVTVSTLSKIGTDALNYNITKSTATDTATISAKDITVTVSTLSKIGTDALNPDYAIEKVHS